MTNIFKTYNTKYRWIFPVKYKKFYTLMDRASLINGLILKIDGIIYDNEMYIKSNSLKALRLYLNKLFEDGNILAKFPIKKPAGVTDRYYYGYKILSNTTPLCLN